MRMNKKEYYRQYYKKHKDRLDIINKANSNAVAYKIWKKEYMKSYNKTYTDNNRSKYNAKSMKRHAAKLLRTPKWLTAEHHKTINMFYVNAVAASAGLGSAFEVDHIIPLQGTNVSGLHVPWNLRVISEYDNNVKRNKVIEEVAA